MQYKSFDVSSLREHFKGDEEILLEMITSFFGIFNELLNPIRDSIVFEDADQLRLNAHNLKGVMSNFYAEASSKLAHELELKGQHETFDETIEILHELETHLVFFLYEMQLFKKDFAEDVLEKEAV